MIIFCSKHLAVWKIVCNFAGKMKKEFGKWLMDIAKYMVTALLLSTVFTDMNEPVVFFFVVIMSIVVLIIGLILANSNKTKKGKK